MCPSPMSSGVGLLEFVAPCDRGESAPPRPPPSASSEVEMAGTASVTRHSVQTSCSPSCGPSVRTRGQLPNLAPRQPALTPHHEGKACGPYRGSWGVYD